MGFSDFFVPKYLHSNPKVRIKFINSTTDLKLLEQIIEKDEDESVCLAAKKRLRALAVMDES